MGVEVIYGVAPLVLLHAVWLIHRASAPGKRWRAYLWAAVGVAAIAAVLVSASGSVELFVIFGTFFYVLIVVPSTLASDLGKGVKNALARARQSKAP